MRGNAENDDESVEEYDDEYTGPEAYDEEDAAGESPDVFLDVPVLKVDEIDLDVEDLRAHVSLQAEVLDLLKLNVGADVTLGKVHLGISGVEAQAQLRVRLHHVAKIIDRVLTTIDHNPEILHELARGVGSAVQDVGGGARQAVGEVGSGAGRAVQEVGRGAGTAVRDVGQGAGAAVQDVGQGVGSVAQDVGQGAGRAVQDVGAGAGRTVEDVGQGASRTVGSAGEVVGGTAGSVAEQASGETDAAGGTAREGAEGKRGRAGRSEGGTRTRRVRGEDGKLPPRSSRRRTAKEPEEPP
ncbi:hypothetical protein [Streptomyces sp. NPDC050546]|uniref:hypothetical protein n=1 Tax=Streptomyces sp. NPDC050546 TaxID=3365628 RepID=UPI00378A0EB2